MGTPIDTVVYGYTNGNWGDLLTSYDGVSISYDAIGNPLNDGTWTYTWEHGRQLATMSDGTTTWTYTYDANGMRTSRTNGTTTHSYVYNGSQLVQETITTASSQKVLDYYYGASGSPLYVMYNDIPYYYVLNLQGDVTGLVSTAGTKVVHYVYDAWGNLVTVAGSMASTLGQDNPLRYRAYVFDQETELYYLQSRYYNPEMGRFLNADAYTSTGQGILGNNMFVYCSNNPVRHVDSSGNKAEEAYGEDDETRLVGVGIQIDIDAGCATMGIEIILYWDPTVCGEGNWIVAVYTYGGLSMETYDAWIGSIVAMMTDNAELLMADPENNVNQCILAIAAMLGNGFSFAISGVGIVGNEDFVSPQSYEKSFTSINCGVGCLRGSFAYSDTGFAVSFGGNVFGGYKVWASWGVSKTYYKLEREWVIPALLQ